MKIDFTKLAKSFLGFDIKRFPTSTRDPEELKRRALQTWQEYEDKRVAKKSKRTEKKEELKAQATQAKKEYDEKKKAQKAAKGK